MRQLIISSMLLLTSTWVIAQDINDKLPRINKVVSNDQASVIIEKDNGEATISYDQSQNKPYRIKEGTLYVDGASHVVVRISNLNQVEANDASVVEVNGGLSNGFEIVGKDAANINVSGNMDKIVVETNDASSVYLSGECTSLNVKSNDASVVSAGDMKASFVVAKSYDASSITVRGEKNIDTQINDLSNIEILKGAMDDMSDTVTITEHEVEANADVYEDEGDLQFGKEMEKWNRKKLKWRPDQRVWAGFELSMTGLTNELFKFQPDADHNIWTIEQPSVSLHLNLFEKKFRLGTEYLKLVTGLGFQWDILRLKEDVKLLNTKENVQIVPSEFGDDLKKNNLVLGQIQVPVLLNINTNPGSKRNFHIDGGVVVGYRFKQRLKQEISTSYKTDIESKTKSQFHQNPFDFSATVRLGIGSWSVFGMYDLATLYKKNEGPQLNVWNIGVTVIPF